MKKTLLFFFIILGVFISCVKTPSAVQYITINVTNATTGAYNVKVVYMGVDKIVLFPGESADVIIEKGKCLDFDKYQDSIYISNEYKCFDVAGSYLVL
ncbi:MAG: hypothetical protein WCJ46_07330 [bacterium]